MWVVNTLDDTVIAISPDTNSVVGTIEVGDGPSGIAIVQGIVWVANEADGTLSRIEPGQTSASTMAIGSVPQGLADVNGKLWVSVRGTATSHRGGHCGWFRSARPDSLDPGVATTPGVAPAAPDRGRSGCLRAGRWNHPALVPDLATSIPTPTEGGRTYAFELRARHPVLER